MVIRFIEKYQLASHDVGLLFARLFFGLTMALAHGWGKLSGFSEMAGSFPDPIGVGSTISLTLVVFAEFFCALAIAFGFLTRLSAIPLIINMSVAAFIIHGADPFGKKELALLYLGAAVMFFLTGPGRISLDQLILKIFRRR